MDGLPQSARLRDRPLSIVRKSRRDFNRNETVCAVYLVVEWAEPIASLLNVSDS